MNTLDNTYKKEFIFEDKNLTVRSLFSYWKIWLTLNEISELYSVSKEDLKFKMAEIIFNSDIDSSNNIKKVFNNKFNKHETFYSLDILLLLWYKLKKYKETKFLVHTNRMLKQYACVKTLRLSNFITTPIVKNIVNYFNPVVHVI